MMTALNAIEVTAHVNGHWIDADVAITRDDDVNVVAWWCDSVEQAGEMPEDAYAAIRDKVPPDDDACEDDATREDDAR